jgi:hypothetical protein
MPIKKQTSEKRISVMPHDWPEHPGFPDLHTVGRDDAQKKAAYESAIAKWYEDLKTSVGSRHDRLESLIQEANVRIAVLESKPVKT